MLPRKLSFLTWEESFYHHLLELPTVCVSIMSVIFQDESFISEWESQNSFARGTIFSAIKFGGANGAWARLERGELTQEEFYEPFAGEVTALAGPGKEPISPEVVKEFMENLMRGLNRTDPDMMEAVDKLKKAGLKLAVLTNNWKSDESGRLIFDEVDKFDHVVESCMVGMRKPEERIYKHTLDVMGVDAEEAVFLDDIAGNLKPAENLGISTIKVNDVNSALVELQSMVNVDLGATPGTSRIRKGMEIDQENLQLYLKDKLNISGGKE